MTSVRPEKLRKRNGNARSFNGLLPSPQELPVMPQAGRRSSRTPSSWQDPLWSLRSPACDPCPYWPCGQAAADQGVSFLQTAPREPGICSTGWMLLLRALRQVSAAWSLFQVHIPLRIRRKLRPADDSRSRRSPSPKHDFRAEETDPLRLLRE